jgi:hypothetical protein
VIRRGDLVIGVPMADCLYVSHETFETDAEMAMIGSVYRVERVHGAFPGLEEIPFWLSLAGVVDLHCAGCFRRLDRHEPADADWIGAVLSKSKERVS